MPEQLRNFSEVRQIFADLPSAERSEERVSTATIINTLLHNEAFQNLAHPTQGDVLGVLANINGTPWRKSPTPIGDSLLSAKSESLHYYLSLDKSPKDDLSFGGKFWAEGEKTELAGVLQVNYDRFIKTLKKDHPEKVDATYVISSAAHWTARNSGATWSEAVYAARLATAAIRPSFNDLVDTIPIYTALFHLLTARHSGGKT